MMPKTNRCGMAAMLSAIHRSGKAKANGPPKWAATDPLSKHAPHRTTHRTDASSIHLAMGSK
jgi:hypothetical protein